MREKLYCEKCDKMVEYDIVEKKEIFKVKGEDVELLTKVAVCRECGNELSEPSLEDENLKKAFRIYSQRHNLILPEEIKSIRENYGASQELFAKILGIGKATLARYEAGALPSESISNLIQYAAYPRNFDKLLEKNKDKIAKSDYVRIKRIVETRLDGINELEETYKILNEGEIDFPKLYGVVAYILHLAKMKFYEYLSKVKFMKLLWFVDKSFHEKQSKSLTGLRYAHLPMGPAPHYHSLLLELLEKMGIIQVEEELIENDCEIIKIKLKDSTFERYLTEEEKKSVENTVKKYINIPTKKLIELSHEDKSWQSTKNGEVMNF